MKRRIETRMKMRNASPRALSEQVVPRILSVNLNLNPNMEFEVGDLVKAEGCTVSIDSLGRPKRVTRQTCMPDSEYQIRLDDMLCTVQPPRYVDGG